MVLHGLTEDISPFVKWDLCIKIVIIIIIIIMIIIIIITIIIIIIIVGKPLRLITIWFAN